MVIKKKTKKKKKAGKKTVKKSIKKSVAKKTSKVSRKKTAKKAVRKKLAKKATRKKVTKKVSKKAARKKVTKKVSKKVAKKVAKKKIKKASSAKVAKTKKKLEDGKVVEKKDVVKETLSFLRTFNFLASDSDECLERKCDNPATTGGYCRLHYIKNWKEIKNKEKILQDGILIDYIEQLIKKFSLKVVDSLVDDMSDEKNFYNALKNMNIDVSEEFFYDTDDSSDESDIPFETKSKPHLYGDD